jgi:hypothetical protein
LTAWILVIGLGLVITSPVWHGACHHPRLDSLIEHNEPSQPVLRCDGSTHVAESLGECPICLSQRLLNHVQTEHARETSASPRVSGGEPARTTTVAVTLIDCRQPRAPPLA